jgi:hypothetical protein
MFEVRLGRLPAKAKQKGIKKEEPFSAPLENSTLETCAPGKVFLEKITPPLSVTILFAMKSGCMVFIVSSTIRRNRFSVNTPR